MKKILSILVLSVVFSCHNQAQVNPKQKAVIEAEPIEVPLENGKAKAYFASGCFWCVEAIYQSVKGVEEVYSGFSGGHTDDITYEKSHSGTTGHAEAVTDDKETHRLSKRVSACEKLARSPYVIGGASARLRHREE